MSEDNAEFMQLAQGKTAVDAKSVDGAPPAAASLEQEMSSNPGSKICQYALLGDKFGPVTQTIGILPAGAYSLFYSDAYPVVFAPLDLQTDKLLRLPDSKSDEVIAEIELFWKIKDKFLKYGFVHKRGFLLWGPPGSGKTSTLAFVVNQMILDGGLVFMCDSPGNLVKALAALRTIEPNRRLLVIMEDIDTLISAFGESTTLSVLDGEHSVGNVVFIATTNYPERLDGRVVNRPSRFDMVVKIGMPNAAARRAYLESRGIHPNNLDEWVESTDGFSIAHMKELIVGVLCFGQNMKTVSERLRKMTKAPKSDNSDNRVGFGGG